MAMIQATLKEQGRTQRWLAGRIGVSESMLSKYFRGTSAAPSGVIEAACRELGLPSAALSPAHTSPTADELSLNGGV